jgi:uncharacterized membrane protein YeaQ/YmgE (transglycosylase-associated protein family)
MLTGYSMGAFGNSIAGLTGAAFTSKYLAALLGMTNIVGMLVGGVLGAAVILLVFSAAESIFSVKKSTTGFNYFSCGFNTL